MFTIPIQGSWKVPLLFLGGVPEGRGGKMLTFNKHPHAFSPFTSHFSPTSSSSTPIYFQPLLYPNKTLILSRCGVLGPKFYTCWLTTIYQNIPKSIITNFIVFTYGQTSPRPHQNTEKAISHYFKIHPNYSSGKPRIISSQTANGIRRERKPKPNLNRTFLLVLESWLYNLFVQI